jgi:plastocyanin
MNSKIAVAAVFAAILAALFATPQAALAADVSVDITSGSSTKTTDAFAPNPVQANVGDTIIWTNRDSTVHTATSGGASGGPTGLFGGSASAPAIIAPSGTQSYTVTEAGDIPYYCVLHPTMVGTITVSEGGNGNGGPQESTATATLGDQSFEVTANSTATLTGAEIAEGESVTLTFDGAGDAEVTLPAAMIMGNITAMAGEEDLDVEVIEETEEATTIRFTIPEGQTEVELMGTTVVPEFPVVAALILGITVAGIVAYTRFAKGSTAGFFGRT